MPVLPLVGSTSTFLPGAIFPSRSSASIMATPMRSFTLPIGLKNSSLNSRSALTPAACGMRAMRTSGVSPMVSVMELKMRPRPGRCSRESDDEVRAIGSLGRAAIKPRGARAFANLLNGNLVKLLHHFFLQRCHQRHHYAAAELATAVEIFLILVETHRDPHHIADTDAPALAG